MMLLVACMLLLSMPIPSIGGSDDPAPPPLDEVANGTAPFKIMNDTELVSAASTYGWSGNGSVDNPYIIENLAGQITSHIEVMDTTNPIAVAGDDITVAPEEGVYLDASLSTDDVGIVRYEWAITDQHGTSTWTGMVVGVAFHHEGVYDITLTVWDAAGNSDEDYMRATVVDLEPPVAVIGDDLVVDQHTTLDLNGTYSTDNWLIADWNWTVTSPDDTDTFYDTSGISHTFQEAGVHTVTLRVTDAAGLWNETTINVTVLDTTDPLAMLGTNTVIDMGETVHLNGTSSWDNVGVVNWTWTIEGPGVNETYYGPEANHTFPDAGVYTVTLNVTDAAGNSGSNSITVMVRDTELPVANAGDDTTVDEGTIVVFDASASTDNVRIAWYEWSFFYDGHPRGKPLPSPNYTFTFDIPGIYTVTLNVTDGRGNEGTDQMTVTVRDITHPVADAGRNQEGDQDTTVTFDGVGCSDNVAIVNYTWTFEYDGTEQVLSGMGPEFTFHMPGVYTATLVVSDAAGNTASDTMIVTVLDTEAPVAFAGEDFLVEVGVTARFNGSASTDNVGVVFFEWSFIYDGKPQVLTGVTLGFVFSIPGEYIVGLVVVDDARNTASDALTVSVVDTEPPVAVAGDDVDLLPGGTVQLDASASFDNVDIVSYVWTLTYEGEEITLLGVQVSYTFEEIGEYVITLTVEDTLPNVDTDTVTVTVDDPVAPVADAGEDVVVNQHLAVIFDGSGSTDNVAIARWTWTFEHDGMPIILEGEAPAFVFIEVGVHTVTLEVADPTGLTDTDTMTVTVLDVDAPQADAGQDQTIFVGVTATFDGSASIDNVGIVSWTWRFEHIGTSEELEGESVTFVFEEAGDYDVRLTVADAHGNSDSATMVVTVEPMPPPVNGQRDPDWSMTALYAGVAAVIVIAVLVAVLLMRRRGKF